LNEALKNEELFKTLTNHHKNEGDFPKKLKSIENSYKEFFSRLKTACDEGITYAFLTGVTPVDMSEFTSGFNISKDLALKEQFWDLYGFKKLEIESLLDKAIGNGLSNIGSNSSCIIKKIMSWIKEENDGYFFTRNQSKGIFNPAHVLYCIEKIIGRMKKLDSWNPLTICNTLLNFPPDPHTLPSQTILDLIVNIPLGKSILTEALNRHPLNSPKGIEQRFQLTNIHKLLATDCTSLLSFMFYTGAITYQPNPSPASLQHNFQIPNRIAEKEFIMKALNIYDWKMEDLAPVRNSLQILEAEYNIEPFCRFVEEVLLKLLKDNSVKHSNEETLKQAFMDTLILTFHSTDIEPEFKVYSQSSKTHGKAIDLVKTSTGKIIAFEFDNIKVKNVKLDGVRDEWQEATDISQSLLRKSEDEILNLEISDKYQKNQRTVCEVLERKIKKKSNEYLDALKKEHDAELSCIFIVLRVGLHRLISRKIYCINE
jgi:hypothetical protein